MKAIAVVLMIIISLAHYTRQCGETEGALVKYFKAMGWKNILFNLENSFEMKKKIDLAKCLSSFNIQLSFSANPNSTESQLPKVISGPYDIIHRQVINRTPYRIMIFSYHTELEKFSMMNISAGFFCFEKDSLILYRCQTFYDKDQLVMNPWLFDEKGKIIQNFDCMGLPLRAIELAWMPWINIWDCDEAGRLCKKEGMSADTMALLGEMFNFSYVVDTRLDGNWGSLPIGGNWSDPNAQFEGLLGDLRHGNYDVSANEWFMRAERFRFFDFIPAINYKLQLFINKQINFIDLYLFFRPFTMTSWIVCFILLATLSIAYLGHIYLQGGHNSLDLLQFNVWILFVLLQAFYGGALTMFLTASPSVPFNNLEEALALHPEWALVLTDDLKLEIQLPAAAGKIHFKKYWDMMQTSAGSGQIVKPTLRQAIETLSEPGRFLYAQDIKVNYMSHWSTVENLDIQTIGNSRRNYNSFLLQKNSPFTVILKIGMTKLRTNGVSHVIQRRYRPSSTKSVTTQTKVIAWEHVGMIYLVLAFFFGLSLVLCIGERIWHSLKRTI